MVNRIAACLFVLAAVSASSWAQVPAGPEFGVNSNMAGIGGTPHIASAAAGDFVVTWEDRNRDGSLYGISARRYDAAGALTPAPARVYKLLSQAPARHSWAPS